MNSYLVWQDYLILAIFLVISLGIGVYHSLTGGRQKTTAEFILANRSLKVIPTTISMLVSFQSAIAILGFSAEMYRFGTQMLVMLPIMNITTIFFTERIIVPWIYPLQLVSAYDYLERRYKSKSVRIYGSCLGLILAVLYMGACMYAPSAALESVTGLPLTVSIPVMTCVAVTYTALGGMRAVIWTDVFQFVIMMGGLLAIIIKGLIIVGGFSNVMRIAGEEGRLQFYNFSADPRERHTFWSLAIGMGIAWSNAYGLSQASIQRYSAVDRLYKARLTVLLNLPPMLFMHAISLFMGLILLAYYSTIKCDPLENENIDNSNQLLPFFVVNIFSDSPGFCGLFLSTLYGGSLSSISSYLSGGAANCWEDILEWKFSKIPESRKALINRLLVLVLGVFAAAVAFMCNSIPGPVTQVAMSLSGSVAGPLLGIFIIGGITRFANWKGALFGGIFGSICVTWLVIGAQTITHKDFSLAPLSTEGCQSNWTSNGFPSDDYVQYGQRKQGNNSSSFGHYSTTNYIEEERVEYYGIENFYGISYCWFVIFGLITTLIAAILISLLTRDKELEKEVDDALLIRFKNFCTFSCRDEVEKKIIQPGDKLSIKAESKNEAVSQNMFIAKINNDFSWNKVATDKIPTKKVFTI